MKTERLTNSLLTRLVLFGIVLIACSAVARYYFLVNFLETEQSAVAAERQGVVAGYLAESIGYRIGERRLFLERLAAQMPPGLARDPAALREWLGERHAIQPLLLQRLFVADTSGTVVAGYPDLLNQRTPSLAADSDYQRALAGSAVTDAPLSAWEAGAPLLGMLVPIRDAAGKVTGVLGGTNTLTPTGFLEQLQQKHLEPKGVFLLVSPARRLIITSNDPSMAVTPLPAAGADPMLDRALTGFRGNGVGHNAKGIEQVRGFASVPGTDWFVVACLPLASSIPGADRMRHLVARGGTVQAGVIVLLIMLTYFMFFRPLRRAAELADKMTRGEIPLSPLPVTSRDEVGHLTMAFNGLLARLKLHQSELQHQAHHDVLTGLPNRMMLAERMRQAIGDVCCEQSGIALLFLDLDGFKPINDSLGHKAGDLVLQEITRRLRQVARHSDTLARVGGDEFVLLATDLEAPLQNGARALAEKCIKAVSEPLLLAQGEYRLGVSIGIAICDGRCDADSLLQAADQAMYCAKASGRGCYVIAPAGIGCSHVVINAPAETEGTNRPAGSAHS
ncbi:diguanylate cyclase [Herbaspirillum sp.]|uniref:diguanylate cyclase domain-containing protein n=1 Tax=Herbaspirillum sp. TaxID=1890675 RepID=UPI001AFF117B|nr:diguanylate cyclase [Herbaspirillum sp.]MBO9535274.1 diguanylate cyclase [Herbaspirillum sp.]